MPRTIQTTLLTCLVALLCAGWGYEGHRIVGAIAWSYLTPTAKAAVAKLLADEGTGERRWQKIQKRVIRAENQSSACHADQADCCQEAEGES